jgi:hypothetical protein
VLKHGRLGKEYNSKAQWNFSDAKFVAMNVMKNMMVELQQTIQ